MYEPTAYDIFHFMGTHDIDHFMGTLSCYFGTMK